MSDAKTATAVMDSIRLHRGDALKFSEIHAITRRAYTPIIFLVGGIDSGKTTLLGSIQDAFLFGPIEGYQFAGTATPLGFEERCFEARARSGLTKPHTPRTRAEDGQEYLHLRLRKSPDEPFRDILFADMSGEFYERAIDKSVDLSAFQIMKRADVLVLLLDGEKLLDGEQRHQVRTDGLTFLRRCNEEKLLREELKLEVMISKWDAVRLKGGIAERDTLNFIKSKYDPDILKRQVEVIPIASRPDIESQGVEKLFGVKSAFSKWIETIPAPLQVKEAVYPLSKSSRIYNQITVLPA